MRRKQAFDYRQQEVKTLQVNLPAPSNPQQTALPPYHMYVTFEGRQQECGTAYA